MKTTHKLNEARAALEALDEAHRAAEAERARLEDNVRKAEDLCGQENTKEAYIQLQDLRGLLDRQQIQARACNARRAEARAQVESLEQAVALEEYERLLPGCSEEALLRAILPNAERVGATLVALPEILASLESIVEKHNARVAELAPVARRAGVAGARRTDLDHLMFLCRRLTARVWDRLHATGRATNGDGTIRFPPRVHGEILLSPLPAGAVAGESESAAEAEAFSRLAARLTAQAAPTSEAAE